MDNLGLPEIRPIMLSGAAVAAATPSRAGVAGFGVGGGSYGIASHASHGSHAVLPVANVGRPVSSATVLPPHRDNNAGLNTGYDPHARGNRQILLDPHIEGDSYVMPLDALTKEDIEEARRISGPRAEQRLAQASAVYGANLPPEVIRDINQLKVSETAKVATELASRRAGGAGLNAPRAVPLGQAIPAPAAQPEPAPAPPIGLPDDRAAYQRYTESLRARQQPAPRQAEAATPPAGRRVSFSTPAGDLEATFDRVVATKNLLILAYDLRHNTPQAFPRQPADPSEPIVAWIHGTPEVYDVVVPEIRFDIDHLRLVVLFISQQRPLSGGGGQP